MIQKAKSIALHTIRYGESSLVAYVYTQEFGRVTLMVNGAYGKGKGVKKAGLFQPLTLLNIVFYQGKNHSMSKLKEVSVYHPHISLQTNPVKSALALFIGEVIFRTIREEESNFALYQFLEISIQSLDAISYGISNFHLLFLAQLSKYLGFYPSGSSSIQTPVFDFKNGLFVKSIPPHPMYFPPKYSEILSDAVATSYEDASVIRLNGHQRSTFLSMMMRFYAYHMESLQKVNSLSILSQVFEE